MLTLIICTIIALLLFVGTGIVYEGYDIKLKANKRQFLALLPLLVLVVKFVAVIPANTVGVVYSPFAGVSEQTLSEGWHKKGLFDKVYKIPTEVQTLQISELTGQTKDSQWIKMNIDIKYSVNAEKAFEVFKSFRNIDRLGETFISPAVQRSIEAVTTKYNVIEVLGEKRNQIYVEIENELKNRFAASGVSFYSITFVDTDAGEEIENAIKAEAVAKKSVETAEQTKQRIEIESQQRIIEADANKKKAEVDSQTKLIEARAEAEANKTLSSSITPELLQKMEMEARIQHGWVTVQGGAVITDTKQ